jgi:hypothetical protein
MYVGPPSAGRVVRISQAPKHNSMSFLKIRWIVGPCRLFRRPFVIICQFKRYDKTFGSADYSGAQAEAHDLQLVMAF